VKQDAMPDDAVPTMISEVCDAFIAAGTPEGEARKAAETLAFGDRFTRIDGAILKLDSKIDGAVLKLDDAILKLDAKLDGAALRLDSKIDGAVLRLDSKIDSAVLKLDSKIDGAVLKLESELALVKWMVGFGIAMNVAILTRLFLH
jgi:hypothetical protein